MGTDWVTAVFPVNQMPDFNILYKNKDFNT